MKPQVHPATGADEAPEAGYPMPRGEWYILDMEILQQFMAYAAAFEQTLVDDDWTRLRPFFAADAVYEVQSEDVGCRLVGPEAIFAGMKKSLNGFDRRF